MEFYTELVYSAACNYIGELYIETILRYHYPNNFAVVKIWSIRKKKDNQS